MRRVLYPGSFDPMTKGHMNIVSQASELFDEVIIAVMRNRSKKEPFFSFEERLELIQKLYEHIDKVKVIMGSGAAVDLAILHQCSAIVRGLRGLSDYDYEVQLRQFNKDFSDDAMNSVFFVADKDYQFISSTGVKEAFFLDKSIDKYVEPVVRDAMIEKKRLLR